MLVLSMAAALRHKTPPVVLERSNDLAELHARDRTGRGLPTYGDQSVVAKSAHMAPTWLYAPWMSDVTAASFTEDVLDAPVPVIVDFWAPWCKPCEAIEPHLHGLAETWGERVRLVRVNVDEETGLSARYGVLSLPTVILFARGEPRATVYGAQSRARFEREFAPHL
jgi:thioredoxin